MVQVTKLKMTRHCTQERLDRLVEISTTIGFGDIIAQCYNPTTDHIEALSNTGVLFVTNKAQTTLITAYIPTIEKAYAVLKSAQMQNGLSEIYLNHLKKIIFRKIEKMLDKAISM